MKIKHKLALLLGIILLIFVIGITTIITSVPQKNRKIEIGTARRKNLAQSINADGVVEPNNKQVIELDATQKVLEVFAAKGQDVKKGDLILKLSNSDNEYKLGVEEINLKLAERELAKAQKDEKADLKDVQYSYKQAEIALASTKAELSAAQNTLASDRLLFENGAISRSKYEESMENERNKENEFLLKEMELDRAYQSLVNFDLNKDEKIFKLQSNISIIKESIKNLESKVDADTKADIDGRIVKLEVLDEILIYDISRYIVNIQLKQQDALYMKEGMKAKIKVKGMDEKEYKGTVFEVDDVATTSTSGGKGSRINVKISIDNPDDSIKIGYDVEVKIDLSIKAEAVVVDFESIVQDNDGKKYIYYVKNNVARKVAVTTGIETSFEVEIIEGMIQGDQYVVNPPEEMQDLNSMKLWGWRYESK